MAASAKSTAGTKVKAPIVAHADAPAPAPSQTPTPPPLNPQAKYQNTPVFVSIIGELDINKAQTEKRQALIRDIEAGLSSRYGATNRLISYVLRFGHARAQMSSTDVTGLETVLNSVSGAQQINVLLHSPGGDGTIVEKMVDMCRGHLAGDQRKLRVIVPNIAKSAATFLPWAQTQSSWATYPNSAQ